MAVLHRRPLRLLGLALVLVATAGGVTVQSALRSADNPDVSSDFQVSDLTARAIPTSSAGLAPTSNQSPLSPARAAWVDQRMHDLQARTHNPEHTTTLYRICRVTAYCDRGTTAAGVPSGVGQCAAPGYVPFGSKIYIPALDRTFIVTDRTHRRFRNSTVDIFIPSESDCMKFGRKFLECEIIVPTNRYAG